MWEPQIQALSARFRLIAFDQRGHGSSPVPPTPYTIAELGADVVALMDHLGVQRASYAGISIGGMAGIWLGANAPDRLDRLVLMCTSAHAPPCRALAGAGPGRALGGNDRRDRGRRGRALVHAGMGA